MHGLVAHVKEGLPFAQDLSLENSADSYVCFWMALLHSMLYFFYLYRSPSWPLCTVFDVISSTYMRFSQWTDMLMFLSFHGMKMSLHNSGFQVPPSQSFNIIMCRKFEPLFYSQPSLMAVPTFYIFPYLLLLARHFWQDYSNEIPDNSKNKLTCQSCFIIFGRLKTTLNALLKTMLL